MAFISKSELARIHKSSFQFGRYLKDMETIGCFFCTNFVEYSDIPDFIEDSEGLTAICPNCGIDSLVPLDEFDSEDYRAILHQLRLKFFE